MDDLLQNLLHDAKNLPDLPGCYLFQDSQGVILYIGKAKNLRLRVQSYFRAFSSHNPKTQSLVQRVAKIDFMVTSNEVESFVLENNLIKKYLPKYNIRLKDDKSYPYVQINQQEPFALLEYTRRPRRQKNTKVYGPFPDGHAVKKLLVTLVKGLQLRDCTSANFRNRTHPCLLYQMEQCSAPCVGYISEEGYGEKVRILERFFSDPTTDKNLVQYLESEMKRSAEDEKFERASILRDCWKDVVSFQEFHQSQRVELPNEAINCDLLVFTVGGFMLSLAVYSVRLGVLIGGKSVYQEINGELSLKDLREWKQDLFIRYYERKEFDLPAVVVLPEESLDEELLERWWQQRWEKKLKFKRKGKYFSRLIEMVKSYAQEQSKWNQGQLKRRQSALEELQSLLQLEKPVSYLECYDVAVWQGDSPTASKIVAIDGELRADQYRYYSLQKLPEGNNDFAMMREVLTRRLEDPLLPDVLVVDGGLPQWRVFRDVLSEFKLNIPLIALAKPSQKYNKEERLVLGPQQMVAAKDCRDLWWLLSKMRDEAHRFSRKLHHKKEADRLFKL